MTIMLKANKRTLIITSIVIMVPAIIGLCFWDMLPNTLATHFGVNGEADGFSSKAFTVLGIPAILLALQWVLAYVTTHDPKKQNIGGKIFTFVLWLIPIVSLVAAGMIYPYNLGYEMNVSFIGQLFLGFWFVVIGNYLPKMRQSYTVGIRVPWTLANEENWERTHRLAGYLWVAGGIAVIAAAFIGLPIAVGFGITIAVAIIPIVYSFILHKNYGL